MENEYLTISKRISTPGIVDYWAGPWDSVEEYLQTRDAKFSTIPLHHEILVKQSDGSYKKMRNDVDQRIFKVVEGTGSSTPASMGEAVYIIGADEWNLTKGNMTQDSNKHYSETQYDAMYNNGIGISNAIKYAYDNGYRKITLEYGIYCFCLSAVDSTIDFVPQIGLVDYHNLTLDLGGSTLKLCVDDTATSKYYYDITDKWRQSGVLIGISYCRNTTVCNGILVGDRFTRSYPNIGTSSANPGWSEQTYGIMPFCGCENLRLENLEIREFMGDAICGGASGFMYGYSADQFKTKRWKGSTRSYAIPTVRPSNYYDDEGNEVGNICCCGISDMFTNLSNLYYLDSNTEGVSQLKTRIEDRDNKKYTIYNSRGYARMSSCYPYEIGILTYATNDVTAHPLRKISASYLSHFQLNPNEKYLRLLFTFEDCLYPLYDESKTYNSGDKITKIESSLTIEFEALKSNAAGVAPTCNGDSDKYNWKMIRVVGPNGTATYDSSKAYPQGARVTVNFTDKGACYTCTSNNVTGSFASSKWKFVETERPCLNEITPGTNGDTQLNIHITEYLGDGPIISNCRIINNHRGGIANLHFDSVIRDCYFKKTYHVPGDSFPAPNYSGTLDGTAFMDPTLYHIDMEDFYSKGVKILNCRFGDATRANHKILLGCLDGEVAGCSGSALIAAYAIGYLNVHDNKFDYFEFVTQDSGNMFSKYQSNRHMPRVLLITNNQLGSFLWRRLSMDNQITKVCNNVILDMLSSTDTKSNNFFTSGDYVFENNTFKSRVNKRSSAGITMVLDAKKVSGSSIDVRSSLANVDLTSPMRGYMDVKAQGIDFSESLDNRYYSDLDLSSNQSMSIIYNADPNGKTTKKVKFHNCNFTANLGKYGGYSPIYISSQLQVDTLRRTEWGNYPQTVNLEFENCTFSTPFSSVFFSIGGSPVSGDKINFSFVNCDFDVQNENLANNATYFNLVKFKNCTSNKTLKFNGNVITEI